MKIPLSWISLYTPLSTLFEKYSTKELAHEYSIHTAEIDGIEEHFLDKVVVGKVISCEKHPESKKLSIVEVDLGTHGKTTILTGAPNIINALYVPVAMVGAVLPGDFVIGERMMAGMISRGMICSDDELGLSQIEAEGIMILEEIWEKDLLESMIGRSFFDLTLPFPGREGKVYHYALRDVTFEIDNKFITNRPDLFSIIGNAREFHAVFDVEKTQYSKKNEPNAKIIDSIIETDKCIAFHTMRMENITVGKSSWGISLMMERAGLGPKMDLVDITNLMMTEYGQPMHVFDADKVSGTIRVRMAKTGEKLLALNNIEYTLTENDMVIADEKGPLSLAGVMGGLHSAVSETTQNIIWESACFDATMIRLTAQRHGIRTDASTRYEKSLDPLLAGSTFPRVIEYLEFLGKEINITGVSHYLDESQVRHITIDVDYEFINMKAGIEIPQEEANAILGRLGFAFTIKNSQLTISVPSWRASKDINIKEDIAEEVARVYGYDHTPLTSLSGGFSIAKKNHEIALRDLTLRYWSEKGWNEVYSYSFSSAALDARIGLTDMSDAVSVRNAYNEEYTHMRRSLTPRLAMSASENLKYSEHFGFFEIGKIYTKDPINTLNDNLLQNIAIKPFSEKKRFAGVLVGGSMERLRRDIEGYLMNTLGYIPPIHTGTKSALYHPGAVGNYALDDRIIMTFGELHPMVSESFDLPRGTLIFDADYELILALMQDRDVRFAPISRYQTIPRELNFVLPSHTPTGDIARVIDAVHPWITDVHVDSVYEDEAKVGAGKKSVNFAFTLSNHEATISDEDALMVQNLVIENMAEKGYGLRSL